ncbi:MAG: DNA primase [Gammaproteobacteria bacterium]|nr:DNA primase [Gammaproteobacteria bacterium]
MAGRIPPAFIDELLSRVDIVEVIDARVPLKKSGREYEACCPFHGEKTPSFKVSPTKQFYHCFGCGAHGTAIGFVMEYDHLDFVEAIEELARQAGVTVPYEQGQRPNPQQQQAKLNQYDLMSQCDRFFRQQLRQHAQARVAVDYLKGRGLSGEIAARYNLGYAPTGNNLLRVFGPGSANALVSLGMLIRKDNGETYDRFRQRVMFPIRDSRGRVIGFGGRVINPDDAPKYLNSPETPLFHKGQELYGLYEVRQALRHIDRLLVVEGYIDVIALAQQGIDYAVATLGTATTAEHVQKLFRLANEVVFCFDGDRAGREAAWRALESALPVLSGTHTVRFMFLPDGEDPDTLVRKIGKAAFEQEITKALSLSAFFLNHLREGIDRHDLDAHRTLIEKAKPLLQVLQDETYRALIVRELASHIKQAEPAVRNLLGLASTSASPAAGPMATQAHPPRHPQRETPSLVRTALRCLLYQPKLAEAVKDPQSLSQIEQPGIGLLVDLLETLRSNPNLTTAALLERWRDTVEGKQLEKLATWQPSLDDFDSLRLEFLGALARLEEQHRDSRTKTLLAKSTQGGLSPDEKTELQVLLRRPRATDPA